MMEEDMHIKTAFACAFAGALMACNVVSLHAAPLPTNVAAMKSMVADSSIQVRWGYWRHRGWPARSWEWNQEPAAFAFGYSRPYHGYRWRRWHHWI
jgi:hypothetical protein